MSENKCREQRKVFSFGLSSLSRTAFSNACHRLFDLKSHKVCKYVLTLSLAIYGFRLKYSNLFEQFWLHSNNHPQKSMSAYLILWESQKKRTDLNMFCNCFSAKDRNAITKTKHKTAERQNHIQETVYAVNRQCFSRQGITLNGAAKIQEVIPIEFSPLKSCHKYY